MTLPKIDQTVVDKLVALETLFTHKTIESRKFSTIHNVIETCAILIPMIRHIAAKEVVGGVLCDSDTVRRYYNESVGFILGEPRPIRNEVWSGIINDIYAKSPKGLVGNAGSITAQRFVRRGGDNKVSAPNFGDIALRKELLSYAHRDILHMWMLRPNGIDDMLRTLTSFAKVMVVSEQLPTL